MRLNHLAAAFLVLLQASCGVARAADDVVVPRPLQTPGATFNTCAAGEEPAFIFVCRARGAFLNDPITPFYHGCWDIFDTQGNPAFLMRDGRPFCLNLNRFPRTLNNDGNCMTVVTDEATGCRAMASYLRLCDGRSYLYRGLPGLSNTAMDDCARALRVPGGMGDALRPTRYVCSTGAVRNGNGAAFEFFGRNFNRDCIPNNGYFGRVPPATTSCTPAAGSVALRANVALFGATECMRIYANETEIYQESFRQAMWANNASRVDWLARRRAAEAGQIPRDWVGREPPIGPSGSDAIPGSPGIGDILSRWWNSPGCRLFTGRSLR